MTGRTGFTAAGNISPRRFVVASGEYGVIQATGASTVYVGISQEGTRIAPNIGYSNDTLAAIATEQVGVYQPPNTEVIVDTGSASITAGSLLMSDANGRAVLHTNGNWYGARALETVNATSQAVRVTVEIGYR